MKYELDILEKIIHTVTPAALNASANKEAVMSEAYILLREEKERLRRAFIKASYSCKKEHAFSLFIEHHQTGLIDIANMVYNYMQPDNSVTVYNYCIECIDGLLTMLQLQFKKYFVRNIAVPDYYKARTTVIIQKQIASLRKQAKHKNFEPALLNIVAACFED